MAGAAKPRGLHPEDIKAEVRKKGLSLSDLSRLCGLKENACRMAIRQPNLEGEKAILAYLKRAGHDIWPDRYNPDGSSRIRRRHRASEATPGPRSGHCLRRRAA